MTWMSAKEQAIATHRRGNLIEAERLYQMLLQATPSDPELHHLMGVLRYQAGRPLESVQSLQRAIALAPGAAPTLQLLIRIFDETGNAEGALAALERYLILRPDDAGMLSVKGQQLARLGKLRDAERAFFQAIERAGDATTYHDLGLCRQLLGDLHGAIDAYKDALRRGHDYAKTRLWLAQCLRGAGRIGEYYEVATGATGTALNDIELVIEAQAARRYVCDWDGADANQPHFVAALQRALGPDSEASIPPGILNFMDVDEATISHTARRYASQLSGAGAALRQKFPARAAQNKEGRLRLGYLSTDFFAHAVGFLVRDIFACHDRGRFEVFGYSLRHHPDDVQARIQQGCDVYRNLAGKSAEEIADSIIDDGIDILIDLAGYTSAAQPVVLAARPAPVQISWLGYLGTSGSQFIDYIIADDIVLSTEMARDYTERAIRLPCFLVTSPLPLSEQRPSREEAGLGREGFVFCSFNQPYKLDRETFSTWMEILRRVPDSRLWLYVPDQTVCASNLYLEAARLKVDPERLIFAAPEPMASHVARMSLADLALDPFHVSGGATSVVTLAAGVPVLTLRGDSFLARMGSSINARLGLEEMDCQTSAEYVAKAVELATTPAELSTVKHKLGKATQACGFFDTRNFVQTLENALQMAWDRYTTGLPPEDIRVS